MRTLILFGILALAQVQAATIEAPVMGNIGVKDDNADGSFDYVISETQVSVNWRNYNSQNQQWIDRGVIEVDLSPFPAGSRLESARLTFHVTGKSDFPELEVWGYVGDGVAELADATAGDELIQTQVIDGTGMWEVDVTDYVRRLIQQRQAFVGLNLRMGSEGLTNNTYDDQIVFPGHQSASPTFPGVKLILDDSPTGPFSPPDTLYQHHFGWGLPGPAQGFELRSDDPRGRIELIHDRLRMDQRSSFSFDTRNEMDWTVDLTGAGLVKLHFNQTEFNEEPHPLPDTFVDSHDGDGVAISADGVTWYRILDASDLEIGAAGPGFVIDLDAELERVRSSHDPAFDYGSDFRIRFQQFDNSAAPLDGREWSRLLLTGEPRPAETDLYLSAQAPATADVGQVFGYDLSYGNNGVDEALGVVISVYLPIDVHVTESPTGCERSGVQITCYLGTLDPSAAGSVQLLLTAFNPGLFSLSAIVQNQQFDPDPNNNSMSGFIDVAAGQNLPPEVTLTVIPSQTIMEGDLLRAEVLDLTDPNPFDTHTFEWDFGDGIILNGPASFAENVYTDDGVYTVTLTATDSGGLFDSDALAVSVANVAPSVDAGSDLTGDQFDTFSFAGSFSDPGADSHQFLWQFGDGGQSASLVTGHAYALAGSFSATLTVTDDDGGSAGDTITVNVLPVYFLDISPDTELVLSGEQGGPFNPSCATYALTNTRPATVDWQVTVSEPWLISMTPQDSTEPGLTDQLDLCLDPSAAGFPPGDYAVIATIEEEATGLTHQRQIRLQVNAAPGALPVSFDFDAGLPGPAEGWDYYSSNPSHGRIQSAGGRLRMDVAQNGYYNLNEAVLTVDLSGASAVTLDFFQSDHSDEAHTMPASFTGHYNADGVAVSNDGVTWYRALTSSALEVSASGQTYSVDLDAVVSDIRTSHDPGFDYTADFRIKFQQYDNYAYPTDGRQWDDIVVNGVRSDLLISPAGLVAVSIAEGDAATPGCQDYTLENAAASPLSWTVTSAAGWLSTGPASGTIGSGGSQVMSACWDASSFSVGETRSADLVFAIPGGQDQTRSIEVQVVPDSLGLPYSQDFSAGLPGAEQGWTYYSSNPSRGRIATSGGRLRMDVSPSGQFNLNEAVLTLDLSGAAGVQLSFFQSESYDERHSLPGSFGNHASGDGVAISVDGVTWYRILEAIDLDVGSGGQAYSVDLDAEVSRIQSTYDAGFGYGPAFGIKFQQYDNYSYSSDGREWDSISVESVPR